jgi:hypothetical protein
VTGPACLLRLRVIPGAKQSRIDGALGDRLKLRVAAPPEDGRANSAVCALLAEHLGLGREGVQLTAGPSSRDKTVRIEGMTCAELCVRIPSAAGACRDAP